MWLSERRRRRQEARLLLSMRLGCPPPIQCRPSTISTTSSARPTTTITVDFPLTPNTANMAEQLVLRGTLEGHSGWVTSLATSLEKCVYSIWKLQSAAAMRQCEDMDANNRQPQHAPVCLARQDSDHLEPYPRRDLVRLPQEVPPRPLPHRVRLRMYSPHTQHASNWRQWQQLVARKSRPS